MPEALAVLALLAPVLQALLMGMIGYPLARRRPGGMAAFRRSGFTWWLVALSLIGLAAVVVAPDLLDVMAPSTNEATPARLLVVFTVGAAIAVGVELVTERLALGPKDAELRRQERERYEGALPLWCERGSRELGVLSAVALLEELVYRAVALGALLTAWELSKPVAAAVVCVAFGGAHWYYGPRQVLIKMITASVFVWMALSAGWVIAALGHVGMNIVLTLISRSRSAAGTSAGAR